MPRFEPKNPDYLKLATATFDRQQAMLDARQIKSKDEITLLSMAAGLWLSWEAMP